MNPQSPAPKMEELLKGTQPADWRPLDPNYTLYVEIMGGRAIIELAPAFAPNHAANIQALAQEHYWDGLGVIRVNDNYVLQIGDPHENEPTQRRQFRSAQTRLPAELDRPIEISEGYTELPDGDIYAPSVGFVDGFPVGRDAEQNRTWLLHTYGTVSAGRDIDLNSGNGSELTVIIGHSPRQLDRNVTAVGRVRYGMELLSSMRRGDEKLGFYDKDDASAQIKSVRLAADIPDAERTPLEVLRTDTPLFVKLIEARRNRQEAWFHRSAGHIEIGNVPLPVRLAS